MNRRGDNRNINEKLYILKHPFCLWFLVGDSLTVNNMAVITCFLQRLTRTVWRISLLV